MNRMTIEAMNFKLKTSNEGSKNTWYLGSQITESLRLNKNEQCSSFKNTKKIPVALYHVLSLSLISCSRALEFNTY